MKNKINKVIIATSMLLATSALAEEIEEIVVYGQDVQIVETNQLTSTTIFQDVLTEYTWSAGGWGANIPMRERGAQTVHTSVYRNGVPSNNPGSGWYDFGHDITSGESVKVISGVNGVLYGSGSIAGTVLVKDTISTGATARYGSNNHSYLSVAPTDWIQVTDFSAEQFARNDNDEVDTYENQSVKVIKDIGKFEVSVNNTNYKYDYDNCYTASWSQSNDCLQDGEKTTITIRNEYITVGRMEEKAEYFTEGVSSFLNESSRNYFRLNDTIQFGDSFEIIYGVDGDEEKYNTHEDSNYGAFLSFDTKSSLFDYNFGIRLGNDDQNALRFGVEKDQFFANVGTSFRKPNLYELNGDSWVIANPDLKAEEGIGYEAGYGGLSLFLYDFKESIEYADSTYYNGGEYKTKGVRFINSFGPFEVELKYNDSDKSRVPEYVTTLQWAETINGVEYRVKYAGQYDRKPGPYDYLPEGQEFLDDLKKLDLFATKRINDNLTMSVRAENITDEEAEVLPSYSNKGREFYLSLQYTW